jgi:periplasmic protein TonB
MVPPRPVNEIHPKYPLSARRAGFEGVVKVIVYVDEKGEVTTVRVIASSGHSSLDQAVLDAYKAARYAPALQHGKPVAGTDVWSYRFKLTDSSRN